MVKIDKLCRDCTVYKYFKKKCYYYWDHKKECSQWTDFEDIDRTSFKSILNEEVIYDGS